MPSRRLAKLTRAQLFGGDLQCSDSVPACQVLCGQGDRLSTRKTHVWSGAMLGDACLQGNTEHTHTGLGER